MQFYNIHSHIFNIKNAPKHFLRLYLPNFLADFVDSATNTEVGSAVFAFLLPLFGQDFGKRYASFLKIGKSKNQDEIFRNLQIQYDDPKLKIVVLTMFMEQSGVGPTLTGYEGQLEGVIKVKRENPDNILVFLGIDPRWKKSGSELKETVQRYFDTKIKINEGRWEYPFVGLKLYPSMGFYAFDEKLKETFEWAAEKGIPVLTHCSYLGGMYNNDTQFINNNLDPIDPYSGVKYSQTFSLNTPPPQPDQSKKFFKWILGQNDNMRNLKTCSYFLEPASYRSLIAYFSKKDRPLKICLAHYGGAEHILEEQQNQSSSKYFGMVQQNWCKQINDLITKYPTQIYTDVAYAVGDRKTHAKFFEDLKNPILEKQLLFGTDFFLTERLTPEKLNYDTFKNSALHQPIGNANAWEIMASRNIETFLKSDYYP